MMRGWIGTLLGAAALVSTAALGGQATMPKSSVAIPSPTLAHPLPHVQALFDSYVDQDKMPGIVGAFGVGDLPTVFVSAGHISDDPAAPAAISRTNPLPRRPTPTRCGASIR